MRDLFSNSGSGVLPDDELFSFENLEFTGSGKAGISLILRYLRSIGYLPNKTYEILVPQWLASWVYFQMGNYSFPATRVSDKTKALVLYHQYGFPQNINKVLDFAQSHKLKVIEDCAHALYGETEQHRLGFIGDFSLFSFSKFFFCYALGAVRSPDPEFLDFVRKEKIKTPSWVGFVNNSAKAIYEYSASSGGAGFRAFAHNLTIMTYALYDFGFQSSKRSEVIAKNKVSRELLARSDRYRYFREQTDRFGICDHLESSGVYPYIIPALVSDGKRDELVSKLRERGFMTNPLQFDVGRFFIEPQFRQCVPLYCHGGMSETRFLEQIDIVKNVLCVDQCSILPSKVYCEKN